jgi:hypothetical protein
MRARGRLMDSQWTISIDWTGRRFSLTLQENPTVAAKASLFASDMAQRTAQVVCLDTFGFARAVADGYMPQTGAATLFYRDRVMVSGSMSDVEYGPHGSPVSFKIGESIQDETAVVPSAGEVLRSPSDEQIIEFYSPNLEGARAGTAEAIVHVVRANEAEARQARRFAATSGAWSSLPRVSENVLYPLVYGAPGSSKSPGSPALLVDTGTAEWIIAGHPVEATTVTFWGPGPLGGLTKQAGMPVYHKRDGLGREIAYLKQGDITGTQNVQDLGTGLVTFGSGIQVEDDGGYFVSWTDDDALPGGAGDVLVSLLRLSSLRVNLPAWEAVAPVLNRYKLAGFVNQEVSPSALALRQIAKDLPVGSRYGRQGLEPMLWPWLDDVDGSAYVAHLTASTPDPETGTYPPGYSCYLQSGVTFTSDSAITSQRLSYAYDAENDEFSAVAEAGADVHTYGGVAASMIGITEAGESRKTRWVWDEATAEALAAIIVRARARPRRRFRAACDSAIVGIGGTHELAEGDQIRQSVPSLYIDDLPAYIAEYSPRGPMVEVVIELRDDPVRDR